MVFIILLWEWLSPDVAGDVKPRPHFLGLLFGGGSHVWEPEASELFWYEWSYLVVAICLAAAFPWRRFLRKQQRESEEEKKVEDDKASRPAVGDYVVVIDVKGQVYAADKMLGKVGRIIADDKSNVPYQIEGLRHGGSVLWWGEG